MQCQPVFRVIVFKNLILKNNTPDLYYSIIVPKMKIRSNIIYKTQQSAGLIVLKDLYFKGKLLAPITKRVGRIFILQLL